MSIGVGIFLIAVGAILAFGIRDDEAGAVNLTVVGVVVMLAGAAGIWLSYKITNDRRRVRTDAIDPAVEEQYRTIEAGHDHDHVEHHTRIEHHPEGRRPTPKPAVQPTVQPTETVRHTETVQQPVEPVPGTASQEPVATERTVELDPSASGLPEQPRRRS
ncbi:hypothetical protein Kfla_2873 [Kribbella flavida DSM 17836]|uniref:DUF6458 domain-containing protein n=1 Tax=Kribbella flavida (strain DSM 17836 / JCM 10339 / NBRC 14399) TaxID=479435 RepID=D2Q0E6_KRIFD|nr:DUF6458 family protein [Kribbella flavida]ADB31938.1 hypothetical protein Kfla_2873 [Kribbella flavida DSM 17836]